MSTSTDRDRAALLTLIKTLFGIVLTRRGPEDLPHSLLLFYVTVVLWFGTMILAVLAIENFTARSVLIAVGSWLISLASYTGVVFLAGHQPRLLQTLTAIVGAGAVISFLQVSVLGVAADGANARIAQVIVELLLFWSVYVESHIIARAISRELLLGIVIAIAVFIFQYAFTLSLASS